MFSSAPRATPRFGAFNPFTRAAPAEATDDAPAPGPEPLAIGLALGGGAARGFAHIGVLKALERHGIRPSVVAGTSIGAAVGGLWASGRLPAFEAWARTLTKRNMLGFIDLALGAPGLIGGRKLMHRLRAELGDQRIEALPATFSAVATELGTGHEIWLTRGDLAEAIHASFCLPGIFTPAHVNGRWLMDGTLVNPVPVSVARALGGRLVIAVNLSADVHGRGTVIHDSGGPLAEAAETLIVQRQTGFARMLRPDRLLRRQLLARAGNGPRGISEVIIDAFNVTQDRIARARLAGDPPDVLISPRLGKIGLFDFHRADEAIALGEEAAERMMVDIRDAANALR